MLSVTGGACIQGCQGKDTSGVLMTPSNEQLHSIKYGCCLDELSDYWLFKNSTS
jgi:hypothetical protein